MFQNLRMLFSSKTLPGMNIARKYEVQITAFSNDFSVSTSFTIIHGLVNSVIAVWK